MTLTVEMLKAWFRQFNAAYFADSLPMPKISLSRARTKLGTMRCKRIRKLLKWVHSDFAISISIYYDCTEREYQTTLLHEMIHYYIAFNNLIDTSAHGKLFHEQMNRLNREHGWHITVSSTQRDLRPSADASRQRTAPYVVLALTLDDGTRMLSVVNPRAAQHIDALARTVARIVDHRWYMSSADYFSSFPKVRTLRARKVAPDVYNTITASAQPLALKKKQ